MFFINCTELIFISVFRKPKRMLTPGPQKPGRFCYNPRFQALINRFENQGKTFARTPVNIREKQQNTPSVADHLSAIQARAINFKDDSPITDLQREEKESPCSELFNTCVESPVVNANSDLNTAISTLTTNVAGSLQHCINSALQTADEETEIQFKFVITKRKVSVKRVAEDVKAVENEIPIEADGQINKENKNIWSTVAKVVKNVFWGEHTGNSNYGLYYIVINLVILRDFRKVFCIFN